MRSTFAVLMLATSATLLDAAELQLLPGTFTLHGREARQQLVVVDSVSGSIRADRTAEATFTSSAPQIARVDRTGLVVAVADGETTLSARVGERQTSTTVRVVGTGKDAAESFRHHVTPILTRLACNSGACHGALAGKGGLKLSLRGYDLEADHFALTRQALGRRIDRQAPHKSLLLLKPTMVLAHGGGQRLELDSPEYRILADWIAAGAPGPIKEEPTLVRIEALPSSTVLQPKDRMQMLVRAHYSDGRSEDVTRWAKFSSSEEQVANVNSDGRVSVLASGEAAISVWYSNLVASSTVVVPFANKLSPDTFRLASRNNRIDDLVLQKLARLNLPPSGPCDDREFIRRAFLDAAGILPTPEEVHRFLADKRPDRRARLIDALLERPEYVDYWAYKWSDLLLVTTRRLPQPAVWSFYQFIRQSVADNKPYDRFAREILTASGSNLHNGAANYFVLHKDITDLTESTSVTFLGMSITCARCHNHPLERWTQDQYWSLANLFSRVGLKDDERGGILVQTQPTGEAMHLRRGVPMPPTPLDGKPMSLEDARDRRVVFVDWLTAPDNPYFARALVNRVWRNFLGRGLVEAEDDLRETNPPTNPELFDHLCSEFIRNQFDVKSLIRSIMNSATYQRSSRSVAGNERDDRFYSRYLPRRLAAEVILDAYSQVTGVATPFTHLSSTARDAETPYGGFPKGTRALQLPDSLVVSRFLDAFGRPDRAQTCSCERSEDASVAQALHLNNGNTLNDKLRSKESRLEKWLAEKLSDAEMVTRIYELALCRPPTAKESEHFTKLLLEAAAQGTNRREALEDVFWAVLTSREFVFNR